MQTFVIDETSARSRADVFVASQFPSYPRTVLVKLFESEHILLNDKPVKPGYKVREGDVFTVDTSPLIVTIPEIELPVIYEDDQVIVVDKPSGVISHARGRYFDEPSVASFVRQKVAALTGERAGIVHRLDRATSGVMICAKTPDAMSFLQKQFSQHNNKKTYLAIVAGIVDPSEALIDVPLARNPVKPQTFMPDRAGKEAQTHYTVLKSNDKYSLLELHPVTGRSHQLRVHLKHIGHPIVGDILYGGAEASRLMLHAQELEITLPGGERRTFTAQTPPEFKELLA